MSVALRVVLFLGAAGMACYMLRKIRKSQMQIEDALFWIIMAGILVVLGVFPGIAVFAAKILEIQSPANLVFLVVIFLLLLKVFALTKKVSILEHKFKNLVQRYAIDEHRNKV